MRASHADREQVVELLKVAFVQGRLDSDELDGRVGQALTARTYADLAVPTADVPAERAPRRPARAAEHRLARAGVRVTLAAGVLGIVTTTILSGGNPVERLIFTAMVLPLVALMAVGLLMFHSWLDSAAPGSGRLGQGRAGPGSRTPGLPRPAITGPSRRAHRRHPCGPACAPVPACFLPAGHETGAGSGVAFGHRQLLPADRDQLNLEQGSILGSAPGLHVEAASTR